MRSRTLSIVVTAGAIVLGAADFGHLAAQGGTGGGAIGIVLNPTNHPRVPGDLSQLWLVPGPGRTQRSDATTGLAQAVKLEVDSDFARALPIASQPALQQGVLGPYAQYYKGFAELRLGRAAEARATFHALADRSPVGYLSEASALREAESSETLGDQAGALAIYERLAAAPTTAPDDVLMRLGRAAKAVGDNEKAAAAFSRVHFEFPFSDFSTEAAASLVALSNATPMAPGSDRYRLEVGRAERLFGAKRYSQARDDFETLRSLAQGDDRELVNLRIAECDYFLKQPRRARDEVRPYVAQETVRQGEALFFYAVSSRALGDQATYLGTIRRVADEFPSESWSEEALNDLATHYIVKDEDEKADDALREMYERFPTGRYAERAAWKIGWAAYRAGHYADTVRFFDRASADFPRSDYRPAWLYWAGRAHDALGEGSLGSARYMLVVTDYLNSYYGRLAMKRLDGLPPVRRLVVNLVSPAGGQGPAAPPGEQAATVPLPPNQDVIRALLSLELYDQAIDELMFARKAWTDSSAIEATLAWVYRQQGRTETGTRQFGLYRAAINAMKRAYPQYLAAGGEDLPGDVLSIIFPIGYWDLIRRYAAERDLDPYFVAALVAQESTFVADIRSSAKAYGLMQLLPSTARQYAKKLGLTYSAKLLTNPEANIRMGTAYLADQIREFGDLHLVLAGYNAGPGAVRRWLSDRAGVDRDEFIDDIPFPETQLYVKKILGTAEDYRRLYGPQGGAIPALDPAPAAASAQAAPATPKAKAPSVAKKKKSAAPARKKRA